MDRFAKEDEAAEGGKKGLVSGWAEQRKARLEKIREAKQRPAAPLLEELEGKPGIREMKTRKLVERMPEDAAREARKDDYI